MKKAILDIHNGVEEAKNDRGEVNAQIAAYRAKLANMGIPKKAYDMAARYASMKPEEQKGFDLAYALVRDALGDPMQEDLFSAAEERYSAMQEEKTAAPVPDAKAIAEQMFEQTTSQDKAGNRPKPSLN